MKFTIKSVWLKQNGIHVELYNKENDLTLHMTFYDYKPKAFIKKYRSFFHVLSTKMELHDVITPDELTELYNCYKHSCGISDMFVRNIISYNR